MSPRKAIRYSVSADYQQVGYTWQGGEGERGGRCAHMKGAGMLVVSLRRVNFGFWSHLGFPGQNAIIFSRKGLF